MKRIFTDDKFQQSFVKQGYAKVPLLSADEIAQLLQGIENLHPDDNFNPSQGAMTPGTFHLSFFDTNTNYKRDTDLLIRNILENHLGVLADYKAVQCNLSIKPAGKGEVAPHLDNFLMQDITETGLVIWCPLVDVDKDNGTLWVVEGSHKLFPFISTPSTPPYFSQFAENIKNEYSKPISLKAGESLVFDSSLIHWSSENKSEFSRPAIQIGAIPNSCKVVHYYLDVDSPDNQLEVFEVSPNFYLENDLDCFYKKPTSLKSLGFVENCNRFLTEEEFVELLKKGDRTRRKLYFPNDRQTFFSSLRNSRFLKAVFGD